MGERRFEKGNTVHAVWGDLERVFPIWQGEIQGGHQLSDDRGPQYCQVLNSDLCKQDSSQGNLHQWKGEFGCGSHGLHNKRP